MKRILGLILVVIAVSMFSCGNKENTEMVKSVDSLYTALKVIEVKVLSMDVADYANRMAFSEEKLSYIQDNFKDTATKDQAIFISDIMAIKRSFTKLLKKREEVVDELLYSKGQLVDLKKDVENNLMMKNAFKEFYIVESNSIISLSETVNGLVSWGESSAARHEKTKPQIEEFIANIK
jgi:hypothetical protein